MITLHCLQFLTMKMVYVYMYTAYKDMAKVEEPTSDQLMRLRQLQAQRDSVLRLKLMEANVPAFPMDWKTFMAWRATWEKLTRDEPQLEMMFVVKQNETEKKCLVMSAGTFTTYTSREAAYKARFDIQEKTNVVVHDVKVQSSL